MMIRFFRMGRALPAVLPLFAFWLPGTAAGLTFHEALRLAGQHAPSLSAEAARVQAVRSEAVAAGELPDPKLLLGVQSLPIEGSERWSLNDDGMTMRMVGLMQEMPNREKRRARADVAHAAIGRAEAAREIEALKVRLVTAQAWIASHAVERKLHLFGELRAENRLLAEAVRARLAGGRGQLTDQVAARQEAAQLAEREDELEQQRRLARAALLRWVGAEGNQPLSGELPSWPIERQTLLRQLERHPQLSAFAPMAREAQARIREGTAEKRGDWSWEGWGGGGVPPPQAWSRIRRHAQPGIQLRPAGIPAQPAEPADRRTPRRAQPVGGRARGRGARDRRATGGRARRAGAAAARAGAQ